MQYVLVCVMNRLFTPKKKKNFIQSRGVYKYTFSFSQHEPYWCVQWQFYDFFFGNIIQNRINLFLNIYKLLTSQEKKNVNT